MKCKKCGKEIKVDDKHYEIDVYRFNFSVSLNYLTEVLICQKCFEEMKWIYESSSKQD